MEDQAQQAAAAGGFGIIGIIYLAVLLLAIVSLWKVFSQAGQPGWASIVPIYNIIVLLKIAGKPGWWFFLMLIPVVNFVIVILTYIGLAQHYGKGGGFAAGLILLPIIFLPILAFSDAQYSAGAAAPA